MHGSLGEVERRRVVSPDVRVLPQRLRAVRSLNDAVELFRELGYEQPARPVDIGALKLPHLRVARVARNRQSRRAGYGLLLAEASTPPRSLRPLARALQREVHDQPLGVVGVANTDGRWERMVVFRPRQVSGRLGAVTVSRLDVDLDHPTRHDAEVLSGLRWQAELADAEAQRALTEALDVERITRQFYLGLRPHFEALEREVMATAARNPYRGEQIEAGGGPRRVAIRILTQVLFCYFLQRKGVLAGDRRYLSRAYERRQGSFYASVLEPLFYRVLAVPAERRAGATASIPFLNGGLFEPRYGDVSLDLPDSLFDLDTGLLGYLDHWTFTVAEETADEQEVAVDPEMLGRVFESLLPDAEREQKGTYYTPRPVVQFMCREALIARLAGERLGEDLLRELLSDEDPADVLRRQRQPRELARELDGRLAELTVLDPAVGSGAFLLGMMGEITRLRSAAHEVVHGVPATAEQLHAWKLHAIERTLFGVDIEPTAVELCRLRLWLSLAVELDPSRPIPPLPNLEYRTVCANSLVDFVEGVELQDTRREARSRDMFVGLDIQEVVRLRAEYFGAAHPERKAALRNRLLDAENQLLDELLGDRFGRPRREAEARARADRIARLKEQLRSPDRVYPIFMPAFSAPEVWEQGGWDVVIMNPPYVGRKQFAERYREQPQLVEAVKRHFGATNDLMVLFGERALQLARPGGVISMIFNDSIFTSTDAEDFRRRLVDRTTIRVIARTKCFEGQVVNGGVIVARTDQPSGAPVRWVEGYRRPTEDFAGASRPVEGVPGKPAPAGAMEVFRAPLGAYQVLPHRPLYRPSREALQLRERYVSSVRWSELADPGPKGWAILSHTPALEKRVEELREIGMYTQLRPGDWVLLGLVTEGGQGLATADDRRFLAAIEGTEAAEEHRRFQERLERLTLESRFASEYRTLLRDHGDRERALLALWQAHGGNRPCPLPWPYTGTFRIVPREMVHTGPVSVEERRSGIAGPACFIPFEKGDQSQELEKEGRVTRIGAAWVRDNPLVIDWSCEAVALLRRRAAGAESAQKPYFRNERLWFQSGVTWNSLASYLRVRLVEKGSIFGHKTPLLRPLPWVEWLSPLSLLALLNSDVIDFVVRTFLGSRMQIEVGDLRRLVVPVLSPAQKADLERFAERAIAARRGQSEEPLATIEAELNAYVRDLYGVPRTADLWVVR
jgi:hypothetical protein